MSFDYLQAKNINGVNQSMGGAQTFNNQNPTTYVNSATPTPTSALIKNGIFVINNSGTNATSITSPTGTLLSASFSNLKVGDSFNVYVYMASTMGTGAVSMGANTNVTVVGDPKTLATQSSFVATFNYVGGVTWVVYY